MSREPDPRNTVLNDWCEHPDDPEVRAAAVLLLANLYPRCVGKGLQQRYPWVPEIYERGWDHWVRAIAAVERASRAGTFSYQGDRPLVRYLTTTTKRLVHRDIRRALGRVEQGQPATFTGSFEEWIDSVQRTSAQAEALAEWDLPVPYCFFVVIVTLAQLCRRPVGLEPRHHRFLREALGAVALVSLRRHEGLASTPGLTEELVRSLDHAPCPQPGGDCPSTHCPPMAVLAVTFKHVPSCDGFLAEVTELLGETYEKQKIQHNKSRILRALREPAGR